MQAVSCPDRSWVGRRHLGSRTLTDELWLEIGEPYAVRPKVGVQSDVMATMAIDQDAAHAHLAHLAEGDLERSTVSVRGRGGGQGEACRDQSGQALAFPVRRA
ncbi:hypothetical protein CDS [Bradyrhizobium sp. G22]|nr:hypothetical protein CDS [Bradyrhizobium sp. G22]